MLVIESCAKIIKPNVEFSKKRAFLKIKNFYYYLLKNNEKYRHFKSINLFLFEYLSHFRYKNLNFLFKAKHDIFL